MQIQNYISYILSLICFETLFSQQVEIKEKSDAPDYTRILMLKGEEREIKIEFLEN